MDRRAKKLEKKRKGREEAKKKTKVAVAQKARELSILVGAAGSAEFGPCWISCGWDDLTTPELVSVVVTRKLKTGHFVPATVLVDRTCLGVKDGFSRPPMFADELDELIEQAGSPHGGMIQCEPQIAQSVVFHAIRYARSLGFEPHRDFPAALFGPAPSALVDTPWSSPERPIYISGPHDDRHTIRRKLTRAVGPAGFLVANEGASIDDDLDADDDLEESTLNGDLDDDELEERDSDSVDEPVLVSSPLERTVSRDGVTLQIYIYRDQHQARWTLEIEDHLGGSTVWDDFFDTDEAALKEALDAIEQDGIQSFVVESK